MPAAVDVPEPFDEMLVKVWFSRSAVPEDAGVKLLSVKVKASPVVPVEVTLSSALDEPEIVRPVRVPTVVILVNDPAARSLLTMVLSRILAEVTALLAMVVANDPVPEPVTSPVKVMV